MNPGIVRVHINEPDDVSGFWRAAVALNERGVAPEGVVFDVAGRTPDLFGGTAEEVPSGVNSALPEARVPPPLKPLLAKVLLHADPERFNFAYRLLCRTNSTPHLLSIASDRDVTRARDMEKAVRRDMHKMTAFVRFREIAEAGCEPAFVAWFEPDHHIVEATAPFFVRRFANMRWSILTPRKSAHWNGVDLVIGRGANLADAPAADPIEEIWRTYYANIFNPARLKVKAMQAEMPKKYWRNLPEASLIEPMVKAARARATAMIEAPPTISRRPPPALATAQGSQHRGADWVDQTASLLELAESEAHCQRCPLYTDATQVVPGEGQTSARLMFVGEQPGDQEDIEGRPFVGPAGKVLQSALERCGIDRAQCFVTNAVKHFKYEPRGKRRLHKKPNNSEIDICRWWLDIERKLVQPELIVALGATAARGVLGRTVTIGPMRGKVFPLGPSEHVLITVHPSYLLRIVDQEQKKTEWRTFLADLMVAKSWLDLRQPA